MSKAYRPINQKYIRSDSIMFPIGTVLITVNNNNPTKWTYGTWEQFGQGRCLVGFDSSQTEFNTNLKTGGSKTQNALNKLYTNLYQGTSAIVSEQVAAGDNYTANRWSYTTNYVESTYTINYKVKISGSLPVLQPYIVVYFWKRVS